jgi:hypothetical protein
MLSCISHYDCVYSDTTEAGNIGNFVTLFRFRIWWLVNVNSIRIHDDLLNDKKKGNYFSAFPPTTNPHIPPNLDLPMHDTTLESALVTGKPSERHDAALHRAPAA